MKSGLIFGAGQFGKKAVELLAGEYHILAFLDNDVRKHGTMYCGTAVYPSDSIGNFEGCDIIVAAKNPYPIIEQLLSMGIGDPIYLFDPRSAVDWRYLLYEVKDGNICVPEYVDFRYSEDNSIGCHYNDLPDEVFSLFSTALNWIQSDFDMDTEIVELGCGSGQFANMLFDNGYENYIGYDFSGVAIELAGKLNPAHRECFFKRDIRITPPPPQYGTKRVILAFEVFEHMQNDIDVIEKLPAGATLIFSVPNFESFNHVRKFDDLGSVVERYGRYIDFDRYQRIRSANQYCYFLVQGTKF